MLVSYSAYERVAFTAINAVVESLVYITSLVRLFGCPKVCLQCALFAVGQLPQAVKLAVPCRLIVSSVVRPLVLLILFHYYFAH